MKNIILIILLFFTYSCQTAAIRWFLEKEDNNMELYKCDNPNCDQWHQKIAPNSSDK